MLKTRGERERVRLSSVHQGEHKERGNSLTKCRCNGPSPSKSTKLVGFPKVGSAMVGFWRSKEMTEREGEVEIMKVLGMKQNSRELV